MTLDQVLGGVALAFGGFDLALYIRYRGGDGLYRWFPRLALLRERLGRGPATALHAALYVVLPLALGAVLVWQG